MAFLADEEAPHPFYTRGFILHEEMRTPALIERAYQHENAAACLLVKGQPDYVADRQGVHATIDLPVEEAMEAIGGTGDTVTGIVAALIGAGIEVKEAAILAARVIMRDPPPPRKSWILSSRSLQPWSGFWMKKQPCQNAVMSDANNSIHPEMTVLDVVSHCRRTEGVFKRYDARAGECVCCRALFESLRDVAGKYNLDLKRLLADLESARQPNQVI